MELQSELRQNCLERAQELVNAKVDVVVMDSAHGHSANVIRTVDMVSPGSRSAGYGPGMWLSSDSAD